MARRLRGDFGDDVRTGVGHERFESLQTSAIGGYVLVEPDRIGRLDLRLFKVPAEQTYQRSDGGPAVLLLIWILFFYPRE